MRRITPKDRLIPRDDLGEKVIDIRLRNNTQRIDLEDPQFLRVLEQQYATRYLESIGIEATPRNMAAIIKNYPLKQCQIIQSRVNGGLHTDTITIIAKKKQPTEEQIKANSTAEARNAQTIRNINLKKIRADVFKEQDKLPKDPVLLKQKASENQEQGNSKKQLMNLNFNIEAIKSKYIFPFNQSFLRRKNFGIKQNPDYASTGLGVEGSNKRVIFESKIFGFPFTQVKIPITALKELQNPIKAGLTEVTTLLECFAAQFPRQIFPIKKNPHSTISQNAPASIKNGMSTKQVFKLDPANNKAIEFNQQEIQRLFTLLKSQQMARFVGVFCHFSYWQIFGNVNPVQVEPSLRNQMYMVLFQTLQFLNLKLQDQKVWVSLYMPMILLTLKMVSQELYKTTYPQFFEDNIFVKNSIGNMAVDKLIYFADSLFDQCNLLGRFIFLESASSSQDRSGSLNDRKNIRKRIFGTSPVLDLLLPNPKEGKARAILAKKHEIQFRQGILDLHKPDPLSRQMLEDVESSLYVDNLNRIAQNRAVEKECQQKMLNVVLSKMHSKIEHRLGKNSIIKLQQPTELDC